MPKCDFNKVAKQLRNHTSARVFSCKFAAYFQNTIEITLQHGCSPVNLLDIFRTPSLRTLLEGCFWTFEDQFMKKLSNTVAEFTQRQGVRL